MDNFKGISIKAGEAKAGDTVFFYGKLSEVREIDTATVLLVFIPGKLELVRRRNYIMRVQRG